MTASARGRAAALGVVLLAGVLLAACSGGADRPGATGTDPTADLDRLPGPFGEALVEIVTADGAVTEVCVLVADTEPLRQRGLMGVTDLGDWGGMLFRFPDDVTGGFWMKDTPLPLSIAFFDAAGRYVSAAEMPTCPDGDCPLHGAAAPYRLALEVPVGGLGPIGAGAGSTLREAGGCPG